VTTRDFPNSIKSEYRLDNTWVQARERLAALEAMYDPGTIRHLQTLGVGTGWHCLEIGGGGGSIAEWLCRRVGAAGRVVATDISTRFLDALDFGNLEVRVHNIVDDDPEQGAFDLVHIRAVLTHLSQRTRALERMVSALKPGGVLLVEEPDYGSHAADPRVGEVTSELFRKVYSALYTVVGLDQYYGRRLYGEIRALDMVDVGAEGRVVMCRGTTTEAKFSRLTIGQVRDRVLEAGQVSPREVDTVMALFDDPDFVLIGPVVMAVWGRRPRG
jgi:2-polyprenyl-3-methyl-5-hydroxy-6-metoxy-1,4-benzoquinol methylase